MKLTRCDNCRTEVRAEADQIIKTREPDPRAEPGVFSFFGTFIWHDFCSWSCVRDFAAVRTMDPSLNENTA